MGLRDFLLAVLQNWLKNNTIQQQDEFDEFGNKKQKTSNRDIEQKKIKYYASSLPTDPKLRAKMVIPESTCLSMTGKARYLTPSVDHVADYTREIDVEKTPEEIKQEKDKLLKERSLMDKLRGVSVNEPHRYKRVRVMPVTYDTPGSPNLYNFEDKEEFINEKLVIGMIRTSRLGRSTFNEQLSEQDKAKIANMISASMMVEAIRILNKACHAQLPLRATILLFTFLFIALPIASLIFLFLDSIAVGLILSIFWLIVGYNCVMVYINRCFLNCSKVLAEQFDVIADGMNELLAVLPNDRNRVIIKLHNTKSTSTLHNLLCCKKSQHADRPAVVQQSKRKKQQFSVKTYSRARTGAKYAKRIASLLRTILFHQSDANIDYDAFIIVLPDLTREARIVNKHKWVLPAVPMIGKKPGISYLCTRCAEIDWLANQHGMSALIPTLCDQASLLQSESGTDEYSVLAAQKTDDVPLQGDVDHAGDAEQLPQQDIAKCRNCSAPLPE